MSSISPKQRPSGQNLSVQFNRSGGSDGDKARINVEKNGSHDYLHPLNDIHKFNKNQINTLEIKIFYLKVQ